MKRKFNKYKPLFKKLIKIRKNVFHKTKFLKFKKQKWIKFKRAATKLYSRFRNYRIYDHNKHVLLRFTNYFKNKYRNKLNVRRSFNLFFGNFKEKYIKKVFKNINKKSIKKEFINYNYYILKILESRLDTILYRSKLVPNIKTARTLINNNQILINNKITNKSSIILKKGDLIEISSKIKPLIIKHLKTTKIWPLPPKHLQINYRTLQIIFLNDFKNTNFYFSYPFWIDLNTLIKSYKY